MSGIFECADAECMLGELNLVVIAIYRPPQECTKLFLEKIEGLLATIFQENKLIAIAGDFNIEVIKDNKVGCEFISILNSLHLTQSVQENTRITATSSSCIDNIFTNLRIVDSSVIEYFISDHRAQKVIFETRISTAPNNIKKRIFSQKK